METDLQIPTALNEILTPKLRPAVERSFTTFSKMLKLSKLPFFPEYTDHGPKHIQDVLDAAVELIPDEVFKILTEEDACALCLAVLLHDLGMHLTDEGFLSLVEGNSLDPIPGLDEKTWPELWRDFKMEASRFSGRQNIAITGEPDPVSFEVAPSNWTEKHRLMIGEFIRRNHPALAHQAAISGFPGTDPKNPFHLHQDENVDRDFLDLVGFIARSHGRSLWSCLDYLKTTFQGQVRRPLNVTAVYLMVLLRIGDYIQLDSERAPVEYLRMKKLRSPISVKEWRKHAVIKSIKVSSLEEDPEQMDIIIRRPIESLSVYLGVQRLVSGLQEELDKSWAVLGKLFANKTTDSLNQLRIKPRRVKSALSDLGYLAKLNYLPYESRFDVANTDIIKKLIQPLYGNRPQVGVRELLQNSIDAIRERSHSFPATQNAMAKWEVNIELKKSNGSCWFEINDDGIGMTLDIIRDYFLKAGASFRDSSAWKGNYQSDHRESNIIRTGRFGVGSLAAFLIGEEIELTTKHASGSDPISFKAKVDDNLIELKRASMDQPGTRIRIQISEGVYEVLSNSDSWNWYLFDYPTVNQKQGRKKVPRQANLVIPSGKNTEVDDWNLLDQDTYESYHWSYVDAPKITCNGIVVASSLNASTERALRWTSENDVPFNAPNLTIIDKNGRLPLDLQRFGIAEDLCPESELLIRDVLADHLKHMRLHAPTQFPNFSSGVEDCEAYPGLDIENHFLSLLHFPFAFTKQGTVFANWSHLSAAKIDRILIVFGIEKPGTSFSWCDFPPDFASTLKERVGILFVGPAIVGDSIPLIRGKLNRQIEIIGSRFFVHKDNTYLKELANEDSKFDFVKTDMSQVATTYESGKCPLDSPFDLEATFNDESQLERLVFIELFPDYSSIADERDLFAIAAQDVLRDSKEISYDLDKR